MDEQELQEDEKLIMVASFRELSEALLAKGRLETAGIDCSLGDDNVVRMDWFWSNAMGGVKLIVPESQAEAAFELLSGDQQVVPGGEDMPLIQCPKCGSQQVKAVDPDRGVRLLSLSVIKLPLPRIDPVHWECASCGSKWVEEEQE